jgi:hypothetical protein
MEAFALPKFGKGGKIIKQDISGWWPGLLVARARAARRKQFFLVPKLYLGTFLVIAKFYFAPTDGIGHGVASASALPNGVWERGDALLSVAAVYDRRPIDRALSF